MLRLRFLSVLSPLPCLLAGLVALSGCPGDDDPGGGDDTDSGETDDTFPDPSQSSTDPTTGDPTSAGTDSDSATTGPDQTSTSTASGTDGSSGGVEPQPDGAECTENEECISGMCYFNSLFGGVCSPCLTEEDCPDGGCTPPNPLVEPLGPAMCNDGSAGGGCNTDAACQKDLACIDLINVPGILEVATCGECNDDTECDKPQLCAPQFDVPNFSGQKSCVDPGSVPNGQGCDHEGSGNEQCMSGICAPVDLMGFLTIGLCGECAVDADCENGEVCMEATFDQETLEVTPPLCG